MKTKVEAKLPEKSAHLSLQLPLPGTNELFEYWVDAWQRSILLLDVLRQRGNNYVEYNAREAPHVLSFDAELVLDGRSPRGIPAILSAFRLSQYPVRRSRIYARRKPVSSRRSSSAIRMPKASLV